MYRIEVKLTAEITGILEILQEVINKKIQDFFRDSDFFLIRAHSPHFRR